MYLFKVERKGGRQARSTGMELVLDECNPATRGAKTWILYLCKCARDRYLPMIWQVGVLSIGDWLGTVSQ